MAEVGQNEHVRINYEKFEKNGEMIRRTYNVTDEEKYSVIYTRFMTGGQIERWENRRNTGMKVTWHYTLPEKKDYRDNKFDNKEFTLLANLIQEKEPQFGKNLLIRSRSEIKFESNCREGEKTEERFNLLAEYKNLSTVYRDVSDENLAMAAKIYFSLVFCPDNVAATVEFYQALFENFPVESILKTLARLV